MFLRKSHQSLRQCRCRHPYRMFCMDADRQMRQPRFESLRFCCVFLRGVRKNMIPDILQHSFEKRLIFGIKIVWEVTSTAKKRMIAWYAIVIEPRGCLMATRYHRHEIESS